MKVLLNQDGAEGSGSAEAKVASALSQLSTGTSDQMSSFKGAPASPMEKPVAVPQDIKGKTFDLSDEPDIQYPENKDAASSSEFKKEEAKVEQKVEEKKEEVKVDEKPKFKAALPEKAVPAKKEDGKVTEARDYSIFPEEAREYMKQTSNPAFNFIKDTYLKSKKAEEELAKLKPEFENLQKGGFPSSWYQHPEAWRLHPQAQTQLNTIQKVEFEESFWFQQLDKIQKGEPYQIIRGYNKEGKAVLSEELEPSENAKTQAVLTLGKLQAGKQNLYVGLNFFAQTFNEKYTQQQQAVESVIDEQWPWNKDEKHPAQKWVKEFLDIVPAERHSDNMTRVASLLYASYQKALELLSEQQKQEKKEEVKTEIKRHVEPKVSSPSASASLGRVNIGNRNGIGVKTFSLEGME
jgi:hypothetical protein